MNASLARILARILSLVMVGWVASPSVSAFAAQQQAGLCSQTRIQIAQELALERIGFLATLEVTNNEGDAAITAFSASLTFEDTVPRADGSYEDRSGQFFVQPPVLSGINDINGTGIIPAGQTATVQWFIIPKVAAGGTTPAGVQYRVGATLGASLNGVELAPTDLVVLPDTITVKPDPQLDITYFQPRDVSGDNPFTMNIVETPIPFTLGVLVRNVGYGPARKVRIASEQPRIVENTQALLVVPQLIGSRVDDDPTDFTSLTVDLGDIQPNRCRKAAWDMITSLSGEFVEFKASYTHAPELGGRDTSVITDLNAYFMVHEVKNDLPGRDDLTDFLAQVEPPQAIPGLDIDPKIIPDTMFETDCNEVPINVLRQAQVGSFDGTRATLSVDADIEGWVWFAVDDPAQATMPIREIRRSDGKLLDPHNAWTTVRYRYPDNLKLTYLSVLDYVQLGQYTYTVEYLPVGSDAIDPVTTLLFSGPSERVGDTAWVLPETQMLFIVRDDSPAATFMKLDDEADFRPAYPFDIEAPGAHTLQFYSRDARGNTEAVQTVTLNVTEDAPSIDGLAVDNDELVYSGDALSVRPTDATVTFGAAGAGSRLGALVEIFRGAYAWPTLLGVPSSPTRGDAATLTVGGENVDEYRYRVNGGAWSLGRPVAQPIALTGLAGAVTLDVVARSERGEWPADSEALRASWTVSPGAPLTTIVPQAATPSRDDHPTFAVSGVERYRWTYDGGYFRAEAPITEPFTLPRVAEGEHEIAVIGEVGGVWQPEASPVTYTHTWDPQYGLRFPEAARVRTEGLGDVTSGMSWTWDGRDDAGNPVLAGWYTIKITLTDPLGQSSAAVRLVRVGDLLALTDALDPGPAGQEYVDAAGDWVVWQDQRQGTWDVFARRTGEASVALTGNGRNHERPRTDGFMVVWQSRAADGRWEVWGSELGAGAAPTALSPDPTMDQTRPTVDWPFAVWQEKPLADPTAPEQLVAFDLRDGTVTLVDPTTQPQLDPDVRRGVVAWQDLRDVGFGEIYAKDLFSGEVWRLTRDPGGQYHPAVEPPWIVWADNRDGDFDLHGYNLRAPGDVTLTDTPENETRPSIHGGWVAYTEDAGGLFENNVRALHLATRAVVQLTNSASTKERARVAQRRLLWVERAAAGGVGEVRVGLLPDLQPVAANTNLVAITDGLAAHVTGARDLLRLWHDQAGVTSIRRYTSLVPTPVAQTVAWGPSGAQGADFALEPGGFLWVEFGEAAVLEFDASLCTTRDLAVGANVLGHACFPDHYSAFRLIRALGEAKVKAVRALDARTGRWAMASVVDGRVQGEDFAVAPVSVVMVDMVEGVQGWRP